MLVLPIRQKREDSEADSSTEETDLADTGSKTELTEKEFDAEIEATEDQVLLFDMPMMHFR